MEFKYIKLNQFFHCFMYISATTVGIDMFSLLFGHAFFFRSFPQMLKTVNQKMYRPVAYCHR